MNEQNMDWSHNNKSFIEKTFTFAKALLVGKDVSADQIKKRLEICATCDLVNVSAEGSMLCGICGCKLREQGLHNLARYEETPEYGCKHPNGSRWKERGV